MAGKNKMLNHRNIEKTYKLISLVLAFLGVADSIYLLVLKYTQAEVMCIGNHGCLTVNNSSYSMIYGIPVSLIGIIGYLCIAGTLFLEDKLKFFKEQGTLLVFGESLVGVIFSGYLTWIEIDVLHAACPFCVASAVIIFLIFILAVIRLVKQPNT